VGEGGAGVGDQALIGEWVGTLRFARLLLPRYLKVKVKGDFYSIRMESYCSHFFMGSAVMQKS